MHRYKEGLAIGAPYPKLSSKCNVAYLHVRLPLNIFVPAPNQLICGSNAASQVTVFYHSVKLVGGIVGDSGLLPSLFWYIPLGINDLIVRYGVLATL